jgi:predicted enzyme related to lactoylglutathione lyase
MRLLLSAFIALLMLSAAAAAQSDTAPEWNPEPGQVVHTEIPSLNLQESADFYGGLFGWTTTPAAGDEEYLIWSDGGQTMGGFSMHAAPMDGGVVLYIFVVSIAEAYGAIEEFGGKPQWIEMPVGEGEGYIGMFNDPHGNLIGLFSMQQSMPTAEETAGEFEEAVDPHAGHNHD